MNKFLSINNMNKEYFGTLANSIKKETPFYLFKNDINIYFFLNWLPPSMYLFACLWTITHFISILEYPLLICTRSNLIFLIYHGGRAFKVSPNWEKNRRKLQWHKNLEVKDEEFSISMESISISKHSYIVYF